MLHAFLGHGKDKDEEAKPEAFMTEMCELVPLRKQASTRS